MPFFPQSSAIPNFRNQVPTPLNLNPYQNTQIPNMSINIPTMFPANTPLQEAALVGVHGFDSAKQFPTKPNQTICLHDLDADFEYVINTDVNNQPSYQILEFKKITEEEYREKYSAAINKDIGLPTVEEYQELLKRIDRLEKEVNSNGKQSIQYDSANTKQASSLATAGPTDDSADRPSYTGDVSDSKVQ